MGLNIVSYVLAFSFGCYFAALESHTTAPTLGTTLFTPENITYILKAVFSGIIGLSVKVVGDMIIHWWKSRKGKDGSR